MGETANTKFILCKSEPFNACLNLYGMKKGRVRKSVIEVGKETMTLETLIHEISEVETSVILGKRNSQITIKGFRDYLSHFISPFGERSFLNPCLELKGRPESETFLEE